MREGPEKETYRYHDVPSNKAFDNANRAVLLGVLQQWPCITSSRLDQIERMKVGGKHDTHSNQTPTDTAQATGHSLLNIPGVPIVSPTLHLQWTAKHPLRDI